MRSDSDTPSDLVSRGPDVSGAEQNRRTNNNSVGELPLQTSSAPFTPSCSPATISSSQSIAMSLGSLQFLERMEKRTQDHNMAQGLACLSNPPVALQTNDCR